MLSSFIGDLQKQLEDYGDMPVAAKGWGWHSSHVHAYKQPHYYDGGVLHPAEDTRFCPSLWESSKNHPEYPHIIIISAAVPEKPWENEDGSIDDGGYTINGEALEPEKYCPTCGN